MPETRTNVGGLRAIELNYRPLRDIASGRTVCYLARTHLNTPGLGILMPESFRPVAEQNNKSSDLFHLELLQLAEALRNLKESGRFFNWICIDMPLSILRDSTASALADKICEQSKITPNIICFKIPEQTLYQSDSVAADNTARLRRRGYHIILENFGEISCPYIRLSELSVDYVMLSPSITYSVGKKERTDQAVNSIITFINDLGMEPIADGVQNSTQAEAFYEFGCNYCAGPLSGDYVQLSELLE